MFFKRNLAYTFLADNMCNENYNIKIMQKKYNDNYNFLGMPKLLI